MFVKGKAVRFNIALEYGSKAAPTRIDLIITDPKGHVEYHSAAASGRTVTATYVAPQLAVPGSFEFSFAFPDEGLWRIDLDAGQAANYNLLYTQLVNVIDHQALSENTAYLP